MQTAETAPRSSLRYFVCSVMALSSLGLWKSQNLGCSLSRNQWLSWRNESRRWTELVRLGRIREQTVPWVLTSNRWRRFRSGGKKEFPSVLQEGTLLQDLCEGNSVEWDKRQEWRMLEVAQECVWCLWWIVQLCCREHLWSRKLLKNLELFSWKWGMFKYEQIFRFFYVNLTSGCLKTKGAGLCKAQEAH